MDLKFSREEAAFRAEARAWLEAHAPKGALPSGDTKEGFGQHVEWEKMLFDAGWAAVSWPETFGGRGVGLIKWLIFEEEYYRVGAPNRVTQNGLFLLAPTLFEFGTEEQKQRLLRNIASARTLWAQAWSEPNAGSDLAGIQSKAVPVPGGFRLSGQKTWCTRGAFCDAVFGLFRSNPNERRHKGLTYFMVPLHQAGVTVRGVDRLDGDEGFADVFFDDVFVPSEDVIGTVHEGWKVAMATTSSERGLSLRSPGRFLATAERLLELYRVAGNGLDKAQRSKVLRAYREAQAYRDFTFQTVAKMQRGSALGPESSLNKIFWSEMDLRSHKAALEILGQRGVFGAGPGDAYDDGSWMKAYQFALAGPIYAGTNEIQRNIIAERLLGLPRS